MRVSATAASPYFALAAIALLVVVLFAGSWIAWQYRTDLAAARERISMGSTIAHTACGPIEYASIGDGPPLLLVHGTGGGFDQGMLLGEALAARGFRAIAMSRFGYLRTPVPRATSPEAQADAHRCLLDFLELPRAAILGVSAGALSSLQFAIRHPERCTALVLLVPLAYRPDAPSLQAPRWPLSPALRALESDFGFWTLLQLAPDLATRTLLATPPQLLALAAPSERSRVAAVRDGILPVSLRRAGFGIDARNAAALQRYTLESVGAPALIISAKDDLFGTYASAQYIAGQVRGARFVGFESGGHLWVGHHEELLAEIARFIGPNHDDS